MVLCDYSAKREAILWDACYFSVICGNLERLRWLSLKISSFFVGELPVYCVFAGKMQFFEKNVKKKLKKNLQVSKKCLPLQSQSKERIVLIKVWCHSSVGRAKDWKSLCPWFDSRWHHENLSRSNSVEVFSFMQSVESRSFPCPASCPVRLSTKTGLSVDKPLFFHLLSIKTGLSVDKVPKTRELLYISTEYPTFMTWNIYWPYLPQWLYSHSRQQFRLVNGMASWMCRGQAHSCLSSVWW